MKNCKICFAEINMELYVYIGVWLMCLILVGIRKGCSPWLCVSCVQWDAGASPGLPSRTKSSTCTPSSGTTHVLPCSAGTTPVLPRQVHACTVLQWSYNSCTILPRQVPVPLLSWIEYRYLYRYPKDLSRYVMSLMRATSIT